jgi:hypothetical protein
MTGEHQNNEVSLLRNIHAAKIVPLTTRISVFGIGVAGGEDSPFALIVNDAVKLPGRSASAFHQKHRSRRLYSTQAAK